MSVELVVDTTWENLFEAVTRVVNSEGSCNRVIHVSKGENVIPGTVFVKDGEKTSIVLLIISLNDFILLLRHNSTSDYLMAVHNASKSPVYMVVFGQLTGSRQTRFWEEVARICADSVLFSVFVGMDLCPSVERIADVVVAHGLKASKPQTEANPLVRTDGRRKCDPTDFHALYLDMLLEISSVSERRAAVISSVFPSLYRLLEFIAFGGHDRIHTEEYGETRITSALDPYISEVLSTDYNSVEPQEAMKALAEQNEKLFV